MPELICWVDLSVSERSRGGLGLGLQTPVRVGTERARPPPNTHTSLKGWTEGFRRLLTTAACLLVSDPVQDASRTGSGKNFLDGPPRVLQPFVTNRAKVSGAPPSLPPPVRDTMLAAALFPELLKELAALAQEHSILCCSVLGDPDDACC